MVLQPLKPGTKVRLRDDDAAPDKTVLHSEAADAAREALLARLSELQEALYAEGTRALLVVLQGRDAAGKDGTIRHVFGPLNSQGCVVTTFKRPSELEQRHDYLWRVHQAVPPRGTIGIFNRSHYEDLLVVRVHRMVPKPVWSKRFDQINEFERMLSENGVTILKFFLHVSREEQKRRLQSRLVDPRKNWKFELEDLKERELWDDYTEAYEDVLSKCGTDWAPWYLVPADRKRSRDLMITEVTVAMLERMKPRFPAADPKVLRVARDFT